MSKKLPTREVFIKELDPSNIDISKDWNKSLFICPRCNGEVKRDYSVVYMSNPPKYRYRCKSCSYNEVI